MNSIQATVNKILTYSCVDGPGNRLVIFLQGCNFSCVTCHNPYTVGLCNHCGDCIPACHANALELIDGQIAFDPSACDQCDACLDICPISASPMVQNISVADILEIARKNKPFLSGITVSGGEATLQLKFVITLFEAIKADSELKSLTCFVDTNGHLGAQSWGRLLPVTDGVMLDIKAFDPALHHGLTGQNNAKTLKAAKTVRDADKLYELRFLVIPGKTDTEAEIDGLTKFALSLGPDIRVRLNAFQHHGVRAEAQGWETMTKTGIDKIAAHLRKAGIPEVITPAFYL
ncbi:MAG: YjjW family glycine radical enzyme activase [Alphaproteobacteria bacterium]|nr:YjjW family glycine radical enzyme activase [Alphaproteobacteria bacterium]